MKKPEMIKKLISFRKRYLDLDQGAMSRTKSDVRKDFHEKNSSIALDSCIEDLYSNIIHYLSERVLNFDRYRSVSSNNGYSNGRNVPHPTLDSGLYSGAPPSNK